MPKLYEYFGIVFYFYANEHLPIHVHAKYENSETIFELIYENGELTDVKQRLSGSCPLKSVKKQRNLFERIIKKLPKNGRRSSS